MPLVLVGELVGVLASVALGPNLVRSDVGAGPVPPAATAWPWTAELCLLAGVLVACVAVAAMVAVAQVSRARPARLREGDS